MALTPRRDTTPPLIATAKTINSKRLERIGSLVASPLVHVTSVQEANSHVTCGWVAMIFPASRLLTMNGLGFRVFRV